MKKLIIDIIMIGLLVKILVDHTWVLIFLLIGMGWILFGVYTTIKQEEADIAISNCYIITEISDIVSDLFYLFPGCSKFISISADAVAKKITVYAVVYDGMWMGVNTFNYLIASGYFTRETAFKEAFKEKEWSSICVLKAIENPQSNYYHNEEDFELNTEIPTYNYDLYALLRMTQKEIKKKVPAAQLESSPTYISIR